MREDAARMRDANYPEKRPERLRAKIAKKQMIEYLQKYPIVEAACSKVGISRSTHYEWLRTDLEYQGKVETAIETSVGTVNDVAESNIINKVKGGDFKATTYWLEHRHPAYAKKDLKATVQKLVLKPKPSPEFVASVKKYDPDYTPATEDVYITEEEWLREQRRLKRSGDMLMERARSSQKQAEEDDEQPSGTRRSGSTSSKGQG
mgnify:FL=1